MNPKELYSFKLSDAISFHDELNPRLWAGQNIRPEVKKQLLIIAQDFLEELGIDGVDVKDIIISGSNAAFSWTPHSDLDLHIVVDLSKLDNDEIYKELFNAKKTIYNDSHDITIHGVPVELYVEDSREPAVSLGEYSILKDKWLRVPTKRRANLDQNATRAKYDKLKDIIELALRTKDLSKVTRILKKIRQYRQAGLDKHGEFGPENLAFKMVRQQGLITKLYALRDKLHSDSLTIENMYAVEDLIGKPTPTVTQIAKKHGVPREHILDQLVKGIPVENEHTNDEDVAREIALDHLSEDPDYYTKLAKANLEESQVKELINTTKKFNTVSEKINYIVKEQDVHWLQKIIALESILVKNPVNEEANDANGKSEYGNHEIEDVHESASGYIPSNAERNDPRYKTSLTVDIKPGTLKQNAKKLGSKISRAGIPPTARADGKIAEGRMTSPASFKGGLGDIFWNLEVAGLVDTNTVSKLKGKPEQKEAAYYDQLRYYNRFRQLPGGDASLKYTVQKDGNNINIVIIDSVHKKIAGLLMLSMRNIPGYGSAYHVESIAVSPDFRGRGIGWGLYGVAVIVLKLPLMSGERQTPDAVRMWTKMTRLPDVLGTVIRKTKAGYDQEPLEIQGDQISNYPTKPGDHIIIHSAR